MGAIKCPLCAVASVPRPGHPLLPPTHAPARSPTAAATPTATAPSVRATEVARAHATTVAVRAAAAQQTAQRVTALQAAMRVQIDAAAEALVQAVRARQAELQRRTDAWAAATTAPLRATVVSARVQWQEQTSLIALAEALLVEGCMAEAAAVLGRLPRVAATPLDAADRATHPHGSVFDDAADPTRHVRVHVGDANAVVAAALQLEGLPEGV
jgi:hypothetical protein